MNVQEQISIKDLRDVEIFAGLAGHQLDEIAKICSLRTYKAGERCAIQGERADELGIVNNGKVAIEMRLEVMPYNQTLTIATLTRGNVFAWSALVEPHILTASVRCIGETQIISIKAAHLQHLFKERPSIEHAVIKNLTTVISLRLRDSWAQLSRLVAQMIKQER